MTIGTTPTYGSTLTRMLREVGPTVLKELENMSAPFKAALGEQKRTGDHIIKRMKAGGQHTFSFYSDGATTADGVAVGFGSLTVLGKIFQGALRLNLGAVINTNGAANGAANLLMEEVKSGGAAATRTLNHAMIRGKSSVALATAGDAAKIKAATASTDSAEITVPESTELRVGQGIDVYQGSTLVMTVFVTTRTPNFVTGTHTFTVKDTEQVDKSSWTPNDAEVIYIRGAKDDGITGIGDIIGTGDLYGQSLALPGWKGNVISSVGAVTELDVRNALVKTRHLAGNGQGPKFCLLNGHRLNDLYETKVDQQRFGGDGVVINDYKSLDNIAGLPAVVDESCPNDEIYGVDNENIRLAVFSDMFQVGDGKPGQDHGDMHFAKIPNKLAYEAELVGMYEMDCDNRNSSFKLSGITN